MAPKAWLWVDESSSHTFVIYHGCADKSPVWRTVPNSLVFRSFKHLKSMKGLPCVRMVRFGRSLHLSVTPLTLTPPGHRRHRSQIQNCHALAHSGGAIQSTALLQQTCSHPLHLQHWAGSTGLCKRLCTHGQCRTGVEMVKKREEQAIYTSTAVNAV